MSGAGAIRARRVVTPGGESPATVLFSGGLITAVAGYGDAPPGTVDLPGDQVLLQPLLQPVCLLVHDIREY